MIILFSCFDSARYETLQLTTSFCLPVLGDRPSRDTQLEMLWDRRRSFAGRPQVTGGERRPESHLCLDLVGHLTKRRASCQTTYIVRMPNALEQSSNPFLTYLRN